MNAGLELKEIVVCIYGGLDPSEILAPVVEADAPTHNGKPHR